MLHAQLTLAPRPVAEVVDIAQEMAVRTNTPENPGVFNDPWQRLREAPLARLHRDDALGRQHGEVMGQGVVQRRARMRVERAVFDTPAARTQGIAEMPHGGEEHHDARLAARHLRRLMHDLGHPHGIACGIEVLEHGAVDVELIAQHHHQVADGACLRPGCAHGACSQWIRRDRAGLAT